MNRQIALKRARAILSGNIPNHDEIETVRQNNREAMPETAKIIDLLRKHFPQAKIIWAKENGREVGHEI